ncbi:MAG TPA: DNRLRE domain-containing protein [Bacteroidia bacterium]|jgi:hypothetical protein|nr:DNRLRE domain-containing protein [Bacteroidia bacterium]
MKITSSINKKSMFKKLFCLTLIFLSITQLQAQTTATFTPSGDANVLSETVDAGNNYGSDTKLLATAWTNGAAYNYEAYIEFNTASIPTSANVCSAYLTFYTTSDNNQSGSNQPNSFYLKRVTGSWTNGGITWNNRPSPSSTDVISCSSFTVATGSSYTINVTSHVQNMVSSPSTNYGWVMMLQTEGSPYASLGFASSDASSNKPFLTVVYSPTISGTTPGSRCGTGTVGLGATATSGTVNWYTASTGGTAVATGTTYTTPSISSTTTYYVDATSGGCTTASRTAVVATVNSAPTIVASPTAPAVCAGGTVAVSASGASTYTWSPATGLNTTTGANVIANPSSTSNYTITGTDANGCVGTKSLTVSINALPTLTISPTSPSTCNNSTVAITASGASTYTWSPATFLNTTSGAIVIATPTVATNYTVTGTNANGCVNTASVAVTVNALPTLTITPTSATICVGNTTSLTASGATTYTWSTGANTTSITPSPTVTTNYTVSGTNGSGCIGTKTTTVTVNPLPTLTISPATPAICIGSSTSLTVSGATTYTWSPATGLNSTNGAIVIANPTATILYTITGTNSNSCVGTQTVNLTVNALPIITTSPATPIVLGGQGATVTASGATTYSWSPSTNLSSTTGTTVTAIPQVTTGYTVTGTDAHGCVNSTPLSVAVELWQQTADTFHAPIYYNGKLGLGNSNPQAALDVTGDSKISGLLTSSNINVSSLSGVVGGYQPLFIDSLGNLSVSSNAKVFCGGAPPNPPCAISACKTTNLAWLTGGNIIGNTTGAVAGTCDNHDFVLEAYSQKNMWLKTTGQVGIGLYNLAYVPLAQLDIAASGTNAGLNIKNSTQTVFNVGNDGATLINSSTTTNNSPFTIVNSNLSVTSSQPYNKTLFEVTAKGQTYIGTETGGAKRQNSSGHNTAMLTVNGDVVIGTSQSGSAGANLWVTETNWADFVFDKEYKLMPLNELEKFYKTNHHLPNVPTQKDIQEQGNNLAQTDVVLLQKIEENTLYIVELKKQLEAQQKLIEELAKKLTDKK